MMCRQMIAVCCQNRSNDINKPCEQNAELCNVTSCGTYIYQGPLNGEFVYPIKAFLFSLSLW
jgi:hypothetical protein